MGNHYVVVRYLNGKRWSGHVIGDISDFIHHCSKNLPPHCQISHVPFVHFPDERVKYAKKR